MVAHYFLGIPVPSPIAQPIYQWFTNRREELPFKSTVVPEDYHITLHFLGDVSKEAREVLIESLPPVIREISPFTIKANAFGYFGERNAPRIFWVGVEEQPILAQVHQATGRACQRAGMKLETKPYHPHITLARRWRTEKPFALPSFSTELESKEWSWEVQQVVLFQSHLDRVPKYEAIHTVSLG
ncbi:RNA 2',3'-cyclic phosphodiesterase [Ammoniphilus sp. YIM 78166]|uniref:RNA 2',3'-cyclic phosphodiesterase n=1 Tax=Ammoniphilus sp. YIM 78166 TaxID=1644106 RepID=UPI001431F477|nr:RNA 2',3'-cyclic phosphodiesterase [Ammoniphilus sp. YIM 78166]